MKRTPIDAATVAANITNSVRSRARQQADSTMEETPEQRVRRLYASQSGPLLSWLFDECHRRGQTRQQLAAALDVTYGYVHQLQVGLRQMRNLSDNVVRACANYLGVPPIVVKLLSGAVTVRDFAWPEQDEEEVVNRTLATMRSDPVAAAMLPPDVAEQPFPVRRSLALLYAEGTGLDVLGARNLPRLLHYLQRAALVHAENEVRYAAA